MNCRVVFREVKVLKILEYENVVKLLKVVDLEGMLFLDGMDEYFRGVIEFYFVEDLIDFDLY